MSTDHQASCLYSCQAAWHAQCLAEQDLKEKHLRLDLLQHGENIMATSYQSRNLTDTCVIMDTGHIPLARTVWS